MIKFNGKIWGQLTSCIEKRSTSFVLPFEKPKFEQLVFDIPAMPKPLTVYPDGLHNYFSPDSINTEDKEEPPERKCPCGSLT
ncbi:MAG: hypothetical protein ACYSTX_05215, partial [Planctomycetota bacterium]